MNLVYRQILNPDKLYLIPFFNTQFLKYLVIFSIISKLLFPILIHMYKILKYMDGFPQKCQTWTSAIKQKLNNFFFSENSQIFKKSLQAHFLGFL